MATVIVPNTYNAEKEEEMLLIYHPYWDWTSDRSHYMEAWQLWRHLDTGSL